jgi:hypothetical protein
VVARIEGLIGQLAYVPEMGEAEEMAGVRKLVAKPFPYLIFYEVAADEVIVHPSAMARGGPGRVALRDISAGRATC